MTDKTLSENVKIPQAKVVDEVGSKGARKSLEPASRDEIPSTTLSEIVEEEWNGGKSDYYGTFSEMSRFAKRVSQRYRDSLRKQVEKRKAEIEESIFYSIYELSDTRRQELRDLNSFLALLKEEEGKKVK